MSNVLDDILRAKKRGEARGITSICSSQPWVLKAAMVKTLMVSNIVPEGETFRVLLIESTCNQVNQFGGYTGLTPAAFVAYVHNLAARNAFPLERLILGGDHLGPGPWQDEPAERAMQKAADMLRAYVRAGYTKLHLDASMRLGDDDPVRPLELELIARRTAWLAKVAEETLACASTAGTGAKVSKPLQGLRYVIGSEVPIPGGAKAHEEGVHVTKVQDARRTLELTHAVFLSQGLESAWERVIALVVQPGVEFGDDFVLDYQTAAARFLRRFAENIPFVYEAHSTDYQRSKALHQLVQDHFAILKVGPALTFAFREAVFALAMMENELLPSPQRSGLVETLDQAMQRDPAHWKGHYHGSPQEMAFSRKYSLSDRIRYYWNVPQVQAALGRLLQNLAGNPLPLTLVSQFMPAQLDKIRSRQIGNTPETLILDKVGSVLEAYSQACG
jgi:D-tagatose-1,6-bisphosphate aldolase subunit GatZ/KbaZ